jgi:hypothetical protein
MSRYFLSSVKNQTWYKIIMTILLTGEKIIQILHVRQLYIFSSLHINSLLSPQMKDYFPKEFLNKNNFVNPNSENIATRDCHVLFQGLYRNLCFKFKDFIKGLITLIF